MTDSPTECKPFERYKQYPRLRHESLAPAEPGGAYTPLDNPYAIRTRAARPCQNPWEGP